MFHCSSVPGRKFSTSTSAVAASRRRRSWPSALRRSSVTLLRPRPSTAQNSEYWPSASPASTNGPISRMKSPPRGCSILMTSAPCSPSSPAQNGAAMRVPRSRTRTPASGPLTSSARPTALASPRPCRPACAPRPCRARSGVFDTNWWSMKWYRQLSRWPIRSTMWLIDDFTISAVSAGTSATLAAISSTAAASSSRGTTRFTRP